MCIAANANSFVTPRWAALLAKALGTYPPGYDALLDEVSVRIAKAGDAGHLDIGALVFWKRVRVGKWVEAFLETPEAVVRATTRAAFAGGLTEGQRRAALGSLPGFRTGTFALGSAVLCAWQQDEYPVLDIHSVATLRKMAPSCPCNLGSYTTYVAAVRAIRDEINRQALPVPGTGNATRPWNARDVDKALFRA